MAQIFSRKANGLPLLTLIGALGGGVVTIALVWYYFSPEFIDVGHKPEQPVPYSHRFHAGELGMDCRYCHNWVEVSNLANVPATETCMNCHSQIQTESLKLLPVRESWATGDPIEWVKVNYLAEYVQFSHSIHVNKGVGCETCHGRIDQMEVVSQVEPLSMGWCLECHRQPELYLRPKSEVTTMGYVHPTDFVERNVERIANEGIAPPTNCSACHY